MIQQDKALKFLKLAKMQADLFSKDPNKKVGCIIVAAESLQIMSCGYNGLPRSIDESIKERWSYPLKKYFCEHAERNALYNACRHGTPVEGSIAMITLFPCADCARALIQSGIKQIVSVKPDFDHPRWGDDFKISTEMFDEVGMVMTLFNADELSIDPVS